MLTLSAAVQKAARSLVVASEASRDAFGGRGTAAVGASIWMFNCVQLMRSE
jgi:hypothetical protein